MHDVMIILTGMAVDLKAFDETHFGVFDDADRRELLEAWSTRCERDVNRFVAILSPRQKAAVVEWLTRRTNYSKKHLAVALKNFAKYLDKLPDKTYPTAEKKR